MSDWPFTIPHDLLTNIERIEGYRAPISNQDRWLVFKEWLEEHGIEAPEKLPMAPEIRANMDR